MSKTIFFSLLLISCCAPIFSGAQDFDSLMDAGKEVFKNPYGTTSEYTAAAGIYTKATQMQPGNASAHYYLGYALERSAINDGSSMLSTSARHANLVSKCFEKVIELDPDYNGPFVVLDPYSKIQSVWASLALKYYYDNKTDSMAWAFAEGKRRGGFRPVMIEHARLLLDDCSKNSILMTSGDYIFFPVFYLQQAEHYREDVTPVDLGLCHTFWYPAMLRAKRQVNFTLPGQVLDTMNYTFWDDTKVTIPVKKEGKNISWTVKATYEDVVLLRNSRVFLDLLRANEFERDVYMCSGIPEQDILSLHDHLQLTGTLYKIAPSITAHSIPARWKRYIGLAKLVDGKSNDEKVLMNAVRYDLLRTSYYLMDDNMADAKMLYGEAMSGIRKEDFPLDDASLKVINLLEQGMK